MAVSGAVALALMAWALVLLAQARPTESIAAGRQGQVAEEEGAASEAVRVRAAARHLGNLEMEVTALLTMNQAERQLTGAEVVAYADMTDMPGRHTVGPVPLEPVTGEPGCYRARMQLVMLGTYEFRIAVRAPLPAEETIVVPVGVVGGTPAGTGSTVCGGAGAGAETGEPGPAGDPRAGPSDAQVVEVTMAPRNRFDPEEIVVEAGRPVTVKTYNEDPGQMHNWTLVDVERGATLATTTPCAGCQESVTFEAPLPGEYLFQCDLHPHLMRGRMTVVAGGEGAGVATPEGGGP
jgi:plastocyanin